MKNLRYGILLLCAISISLQAMDNAHLFRTPLFFGEPRLAKQKLTSFDIVFAGGSTCKGRNACGYTTDLLDIYGPQNMHLLGSNVPCKDLSTPEDVALVMLERIASRDCFGYLHYCGQFRTIEAMFSWTQNFTNGAFIQVYVPIRRIELYNLYYTDLSPCDCPCPNRNDPNWQFFLSIYDQIFERYRLNVSGYKKEGLGDTTFLFGWACNYEDVKTIDYLDFSIRFGFLFPSGKKKNENWAFDFPLGYNGHFGFPIAVNCSLGTYDWFTAGLHAGVYAFIEKSYALRMKTNMCQSGFIKLAKGCAKVSPGAIWDIGAFVKADHFCRGFSLLFGYTYQQQRRTTLNPENTTVFDPAVVNSDQMFMPWSMHTLHFMAEYDFSKENERFGCRLGIFYNRQIAGKRVFQTHTAGGSFGIDLSFSF